MSELVHQQGYARGRATRQLILEAAAAMFGEVGFTAASLREIAARAGISHPGLLHHFPSKQDLLLAVLERRDAQDSAQFELEPEQGAATLWRLVDFVAESARNPGLVELFCVLSAEATSPDHPAREYFTARYAKAMTSATRTFEAARAAGELRAGVDPARAGVALIALMDGLRLQWLLDRDGVDMPGELWAHLAALLVRVPQRVGARV